MCVYCESKVVDIFKDGKRLGEALGRSFGFSGFTARNKQWKNNKTRIIRTVDKKVRLIVENSLSAPIGFCPKCGKNLIQDTKVINEGEKQCI